MGYDKSRLVLHAQAGSGTALTGTREWVYVDTGGEATSVYVANGYFSDAYDRGVRVKDNIRIRDLANNKIYDAYFSISQDTGATQGTVVLDTD